MNRAWVYSITFLFSSKSFYKSKDEIWLAIKNNFVGMKV